MRLLCAFLSLLFLNPLVAQEFPRGWQGKWSGEVEVWSPGKQQDAFPMSLDIQPTDTSWTYTIFYDHNKLPAPDVRPYSIVILNDSLQHFAIDEHNDILLDAYYLDNCLYSVFAGMGSQLQSRVCHEGDHLEYEITSFYEDAVRTSGDTVIGTDTIPPIQSYQVYSVMKAHLVKEE